MMDKQNELPIIQRTYDLIAWYVPILNRMPRDYRFVLGERIQDTLYGLLEGLIRARYRRDRVATLETLNAELDVLRYQTRLCLTFKLFSERRYEHASKFVNAIGVELGAWTKQQKRRQSEAAEASA